MKRLIVALAMLPLAAIAQNSNQGVPFNGEIVDINGEPVKRARIYVTDANRYALTDRKGRFGLTDVKPTDTLHIKWNEVQYDIPVDDRKGIRIRLAQTQYTAENDDELVSIGFDYVRTRERYNAATSVISGEDIVRTGRDDVLEALMGLVPGLNVMRGNNGEGTKAYIRGTTSINGPTEALYVIDGVIVETLLGIDVHAIDHVEILKDANIFGAMGGNGAIVIYTKRGQ
ncbi:MAG: TonB-dependent receptor plug domain-containing protein [Salinivirgaceae bacterium]|nr:TonB-dependent receptor plug domain-containing protein [Salinivirgaceae bacterium]